MRHIWLLLLCSCKSIQSVQAPEAAPRKETKTEIVGEPQPRKASGWLLLIGAGVAGWLLLREKD